MKPRVAYALIALVVFAIEVCIALFVTDAFIRPYVGDVLAVVLVYCALRAIGLGTIVSLAASLAIAFAIEFAQLFGFLDVLGLSQNRVARVVLGGAFDPLDLLAYAVGALLAGAAEFVRRRL